MQAARKLMFEQLSTIYPNQEIESLSLLIFEKILGLSRIQIRMNPNETVSAANLAQIKEIINRLIHFEPIQYVLGETEFYGCNFIVNPSVLIPRQETEELVDWIIRDCNLLNPKILDLGTGSGCIPIALMKNLRGSAAEGWDISKEALLIANENAIRNLVDVNFKCIDIFNPPDSLKSEKYDIIVSNPPYVTFSEKELMHQNVIQFEPHLALFVPDTDALVFYRKIAEMAIRQLKPGGHLYLEINEKFGNETAELLALKGFISVNLRKDIHGRDRMIRGEKP